MQQWWWCGKSTVGIRWGWVDQTATTTGCVQQLQLEFKKVSILNGGIGCLTSHDFLALASTAAGSKE